MNNKPVNAILRTFVIEEHDRKKYKMMFVEEIAAEPSVETVEKECQGLQVYNYRIKSKGVEFDTFQSNHSHY